jgi:hypothetical protein
MKFISISIAALSLGANVFAIPTSLISHAGSVASGLKNNDVLSTVTGAVETVPVVETITGEVAGAADTATSVLSKKAGSVVTTITGSVATLKTSMQSDVTSLSMSLSYLMTSQY